MAVSGGASVTVLAETSIFTGDGQLPALYLDRGDRVICASRGMVRLVGVTRYRARVDLMRVAAGALGATKPQNTLVLPVGSPLPPGIPAQPLGPMVVDLVTLCLPGPGIVLADGVKLATCGAGGARAAA